MNALQRIRRARIARDIAELDLQRALVQAAQDGVRQVDMAAAAQMAQPSVSTRLAHASRVPQATKGFSGADPYEIAQRYHLGYISEGQLMDELSRWEYLPEPEPEHIFDDGGPNPPGIWDDVVRAHRHKLISDEQYNKLLELDDEA